MLCVPYGRCYQALYRACSLGKTGCGFLFVWSVFVLLKQLAATYSLNLDMNIIQLGDTIMPCMPLYCNQFDIAT